MEWVDARRRLGVLTNADTPEDAEEARKFGAEVRTSEDSSEAFSFNQ